MHIKTWFLKELTEKFELFIVFTEFSYLNSFTSPVRISYKNHWCVHPNVVYKQNEIHVC